MKRPIRSDYLKPTYLGNVGNIQQYHKDLELYVDWIEEKYINKTETDEPDPVSYDIWIQWYINNRGVDKAKAYKAWELKMKYLGYLL